MKRCGFVMVGIVCLFALATGVSPGATSQAKKRNPPPKVDTAPAQLVLPAISWSPAMATIMNLSKENFDSIGLSRLTPVQYGALAMWYFRYGRVACPSFFDGHDKVRVNVRVSADDTVRDEVLSPLLDSLRAAGDISITDSTQDADAIVSVVAMRSVSKQGEPMRVYSAAMMTYQPCKQNNSSTDSDIFATFLGPLELVTGASPDELASELYKAIDAEVLDQLRKQRDQVQDMLKGSKKPGF